VPDLWLIGEHGGCVRSPITREWEMARPMPGDEWKARVLPLLEHFIDRTPGSFLEEKELALVWHHRLADPEFGEWLAHELVATLDEMLAETELRAIRGNKTVEVRFAWANKGTGRRSPAVAPPRRRLPARHRRRSHRRGPVPAPARRGLDGARRRGHVLRALLRGHPRPR
jgi:trehalose-6-phosphatase